MTRRKKISLIGAGIIAVLLLFATFVLPLIVRSQAVKAIEAERQAEQPASKKYPSIPLL